MILACLFESCKTEDIEVSREVVFNVKPYSIVADFIQYEVNPGDLVNFGYSSNPEYYKLRTYLMVYDMDGLLVQLKTADLNNYNETMPFVLDLPEGEYIVVSLAHIINKHTNVSYWDVQGTNRLESLSIRNNAAYLDLWIKILGVTSVKVKVGVDETDYTINLKPEGALFINYFRNIHYYTDYVSYQMYMDKEPSVVSFNNDGICSSSYNEATGLNYPSSAVLKEDSFSSNNVYWYGFYTPLQNTRFEWHAWDNGGIVHVLGGSISANVRKGKIYRSTIDLQAGIFEIVEMGEGINEGQDKLINNIEVINDTKK